MVEKSTKLIIPLIMKEKKHMLSPKEDFDDEISTIEKQKNKEYLDKNCYMSM